VQKLGFIASCFLMALASPVETRAEAQPAADSSAPAAAAESPTSLDPRDPSFEQLSGSVYKPNATYRIREFKEGSVESLEGMTTSLRKRSEENLKRIRSLQDRAQELEFKELERYVTSLADLRQKQVDLLRKLGEYEAGPYQTNLSLYSLRQELQGLDQEIGNLKQTLSGWRKNNSIAWE
jgi:hypothetical protein